MKAGMKAGMKTATKRRVRQLDLPFLPRHCGVRKGAGRKRKGDRARVGHRVRKGFSKLSVLHVTCRIGAGLPSLRAALTVALLMNYLAQVAGKEGFRIVEYSIQGNHIHMIVEAQDDSVLSRAMNGILSGMARLLNRHWKRRGKVFVDRYDAVPVSSPTQCRNTLVYVLANARKHGSRSLGPSLHTSLEGEGADPCSTVPWFPFDPPDDHPLAQPGKPKPASSPKSWLLSNGWRKGGTITARDHPCLPKSQHRSASEPPPAPSALTRMIHEIVASRFASGVSVGLTGSLRVRGGCARYEATQEGRRIEAMPSKTPRLRS